jgi:DNA-binding SARP family transcriptional activator
MRLYALSGNRYQARRQYQECVEAIRKQLDAEPEPETVELQRQIESGLFRPRAVIDISGAIESIAILPLLNASGDPGSVSQATASRKTLSITSRNCRLCV